MKKTKLYYDEEGDFLEIGLGEPIECIAREISPGVFVRFDKNGKANSVSILDFKRRANMKDVEFNLPLSFEVSE